MYNLNRADLFHSVVPLHDEYGETEITQKQWNEIYLRASEIGGEVKGVIDEINFWVKTIFQTETIFTILGI